MFDAWMFSHAARIDVAPYCTISFATGFLVGGYFKEEAPIVFLPDHPLVKRNGLN